MTRKYSLRCCKFIAFIILLSSALLVRAAEWEILMNDINDRLECENISTSKLSEELMIFYKSTISIFDEIDRIFIPSLSVLPSKCAIPPMTVNGRPVDGRNVYGEQVFYENNKWNYLEYDSRTDTLKTHHEYSDLEDFMYYMLKKFIIEYRSDDYLRDNLEMNKEYDWYEVEKQYIYPRALKIIQVVKPEWVSRFVNEAREMNIELKE